jgi:hypothetical protein
MKVRSRHEYLVFMARRFSHGQPTHIARVISGKRGAVSLYGTALCHVRVGAYPESGETGKLENATCAKCRRKYAALPVIYWAADIKAARTSPLGECSCMFEASTQPGEWTRPVTDRHCSVHNDEPAPLVWGAEASHGA